MVRAGRSSVRTASRQWLLAVCAVLATLYLSGCETVPEASEAAAADDPRAAFDQRQSRLAEMQLWSANGRLSLATASDSANVTVRWKQFPSGYTIRLSGPLGAGAAELRGHEGLVVLEVDDKLYSAPDADSLVSNVMRLDLPVNGMRYWLMGLLVPGAEVGEMTFDEGGRLTYLEQSGWKIRYRRYSKTSTLDMPTKIFMDSAEVRARVVVQSWEFEQST